MTVSTRQALRFRPDYVVSLSCPNSGWSRQGLASSLPAFLSFFGENLIRFHISYHVTASKAMSSSGNRQSISDQQIPHADGDGDPHGPPAAGRWPRPPVNKRCSFISDRIEGNHGKKGSSVRLGFCKGGCSLYVVQQLINSLTHICSEEITSPSP